MNFLRAIFIISLLVLPLGAFSQNVPPEVTATIPDAALYSGAAPKVIDLTGFFKDPDTTAIRLTTVLGDIDIGLYDQRTPITVANFLHYIDEGRYLSNDPTTNEPAPLFFHRSVPGFVIQSGGFLGTVNPSDPAHIQATQVLAFDPIQNEPGISNTRGTIAMAKLSDQPDSATSQWYLNLVDNTFLDSDNGGFTVFGRVFGDGMTVADAIAAVPRYNFGSPFDTVPLRNYTSPNLITPDNLITIPGISYISSLSFSAMSDHPGLATVKVSGTNLFVTPKAAGSAQITVTATDIDGASVSQMFVVTMSSYPMHLANISTRVVVGTNDAALIGGFIIRGDAPKRVVIRAIGPSLADAGLMNVLADPTLEVHDGSGALLASNNNWQDAANQQEIADLGLAPTNPNESALLVTLPSSPDAVAYTAVIYGVGGGGLGLVEVYDVDSGPGSTILNISTRGDVQSGDNVMIGGLIVGGEGAQRVLVRGIGPSLANAGISDPLADPTLTLYDSQGMQIDFNDDWQDNPAEAEIVASTIAPTDPKESAVLQDLAPGAYTAILRGAGTATGTGLVEAYALEPAR